jgi:hypothetical protein
MISRYIITHILASVFQLQDGVLICPILYEIHINIFIKDSQLFINLNCLLLDRKIHLKKYMTVC